MKKLFLALTVFVSSASLVSATTASVSINQTIDSSGPVNSRLQVMISTSPTRAAIKQELEEKREAAIAARCEQITARINNRLNFYETNKDKWHSRHQGVIDRLKSLEEKLASKSCDTSQLTADIAQYETYLADFAASFRQFHQTLSETRQYACGESEGQFAGTVEASRTQLQTMKQAAEKLQNFFKNSLRTHLHTLAQTCLNPTNTSE